MIPVRYPSPLRRRPRRIAHATKVALVLMLTACATPPREPILHAPPAPGPAAGPAVDASYDWHVLLLEPFGILLRESPVPLHEVLLFQDAGHSPAEGENKDCFAIDGTPPRFVDRTPDQFLLCFEHDRLSRIEASVSLAAADAPAVFARACAVWSKGAAPAGPTCEGREDTMAFRARLLLPPGEAPSLSMTVSQAGHEK